MTMQQFTDFTELQLLQTISAKVGNYLGILCDSFITPPDRGVEYGVRRNTASDTWDASDASDPNNVYRDMFRRTIVYGYTI